jgi:hypothetical protein
VEYGYWALSEELAFGITNPTHNAICQAIDGTPYAGLTPTDPALCAAAGTPTNPLVPNPSFSSGPLPYDL